MSRRPKRYCEGDLYEKGDNAPDLKKLARYAIESFLSKKSWFAGGPIPRRELYTDNNIKTILRTPFDDKTFKFIHEECLTKVDQPRWYTEKTVSWQVTFLIQLLNEMKALGLPKDFQPGLVLLYFKFCVGVNVPPPPML